MDINQFRLPPGKVKNKSFIYLGNPQSLRWKPKDVPTGWKRCSCGNACKANKTSHFAKHGNRCYACFMELYRVQELERKDTQRQERNYHKKCENKTRRLDKINKKIKGILRGRISSFIRLVKIKKVGSAVRDLGCTVEELIKKLEEKFHPNPETGEAMSWENHGLRGWHVDHVKPLASFDLSVRDQFLEAVHFTNLQPLWWKENLSKNDKLNHNNWERGRQKRVDSYDFSKISKPLSILEKERVIKNELFKQSPIRRQIIDLVCDLWVKIRKIDKIVSHDEGYGIVDFDCFKLQKEIKEKIQELKVLTEKCPDGYIDTIFELLAG